jgi:hypothetical protein
MSLEIKNKIELLATDVLKKGEERPWTTTALIEQPVIQRGMVFQQWCGSRFHCPGNVGGRIGSAHPCQEWQRTNDIANRAQEDKENTLWGVRE